MTLDTRPETQSQEFDPRDITVSQDTAVTADFSSHDFPEEDKVVQLPEQQKKSKRENVHPCIATLSRTQSKERETSLNLASQL